jgi:hypothetical protein
MDTLFEELRLITPISPQFKDFLLAHTVQFEFAAGGHLPYRTAASAVIYFVAHGSLSGISKIDNREHPLVLYSKGDFIIPSLHRRYNEYYSKLYVINDAVLFGIDLARARMALTIYPETLDLLLGIMQHQIQKGYQRELFLRLPPKERFVSLFKHRPSLFLESSSALIAAYLNISKRQLIRYKKMK